MIKKSPKSKTGVLQEHPEDAPAGWAPVQDKLAAATGLSVLLIDGPQPPAFVVSNNNSICRAFQSSPEHASLCEPYCGEAHSRAMGAGSVSQYKCHAGLQCFTMPLQIAEEENLAVIGGRAFVTGADYRVIVERLRTGDLKGLLSKDPFESVIFADLPRFDELASRLQKAARDFGGGKSVEQITEQKTSPSKSSKPTAELQREIDQLRGELAYRSRVAESLQHFLERISSTDPQETYQAILKNSKELLLAERASLQVFDGTANELILRAGIGLSTETSEASHTRSGEGISGRVLETGKALVVENIDHAGLKAAPLKRKYKTKSFISYPVTIGGRKIAVLNFTDKTGGGRYDEVDLSLLDIIGPQVALALERAEWQERATEFQLMSITDPLTGLLNRRYLQERLNEELNRSKRYEYPMSFLMIDIDDFKSYNDHNGHQAGDLALQITARCLKVALRSADVACRYGGEEFCILLPQTPASEAGVIAERMRQRVMDTHYPHGKSQQLGSVSISIGVSSFSQHIDTAERVIAAADRALYHAKGQGKNRVEFYQESLIGAANSHERR